MKYVYCVVIPLLLQLIVVYTIIQMNTGNGSWIGLGVLLLAIPTLPLTTIINAVRTRSKVEMKVLMLFGQSLLIAFVLPIIIAALYIGLILLESII